MNPILREDMAPATHPYPLHGVRLLCHSCVWCSAGGSCEWTGGDEEWFSRRWWLKVLYLKRGRRSRGGRAA